MNKIVLKNFKKGGCLRAWGAGAWMEAGAWSSDGTIPRDGAGSGTGRDGFFQSIFEKTRPSKFYFSKMTKIGMKMMYL